MGFAYGGAIDSSGGLGFKSGGYVYWENYRLGRADYGGEIHSGDWFNSILGGFVLENAMSKHLRTRVALEAKFFRPFPEELNEESSVQTKSEAYLHEAKANYVFGDPEDSKWDAEVGYFIYDYNPDQHDLGEYLFRSKIYPVNLFTDFEFPKDRLLGIRIGNKPFAGFHQDVLLTSEYKYYPKSDFSLSYLADYNLAGVLTIGAGADCVHCLPVRPSLVTPKSDQNTFIQIPAQKWVDSSGAEHVIAAPMQFFKTQLDYQAGVDSIARLDPQSNNYTLYPQIQTTTTNFTYQGVSLMGRFAFDPKPLFGSPKFFSAEDMKLYGEVAVLGVKDYPYLYPSIKRRIPVMLGFDIPVFHVLDVLGVEAEYLAYNWPDNWEKSLRERLPQPGGQNYTFTDDNYGKDNWKWAVYARKQISQGLFVSGQVASDHLRLPDKDGRTYESLMKYTGNPLEDGEWWGIVRVTASY